MRVNGKTFDGWTSSVYTNRSLRALAGPTTDHFTEFRPKHYWGARDNGRLLARLFKHRLCCFISGTFAAFVAGVFNSYKALALFIAIDDTPLQNLLFQTGWERLPYINLDGFQLGLVEALPEINTMTYHIMKDGYCAILLIFGIDATSSCGPTSNIDFIHFIGAILNFSH
jgi:hypothetical protein